MSFVDRTSQKKRHEAFGAVSEVKKEPRQLPITPACFFDGHHQPRATRAVEPLTKEVHMGLDREFEEWRKKSRNRLDRETIWALLPGVFWFFVAFTIAMSLAFSRIQL